MTVKELKMIKQLLNHAELDCGCLTTEEVEYLQQVTNAELYAQQVKEFLDHFKQSMPNMPNGTPEQQAALDAAFDKFYDLDITIYFNGKSVTIGNEATIYNGILDTLTDYVDYCL